MAVAGGDLNALNGVAMSTLLCPSRERLGFSKKSHEGGSHIPICQTIFDVAAENNQSATYMHHASAYLLGPKQASACFC